jgi:OPA family glycerol-3-phosphate transporter-like MFS transporter
MLTFALAGTAAANLAMGFAADWHVMLIIWGINGAMQSMAWPPTIRLISEVLPHVMRKRAAILMSTTFSCAILVTYLLTALLIRAFSWHYVFYVTAAIMLLMCFVWLIGTRYAGPLPGRAVKRGKPGGGKITILPLLAPICVAMIFQGALRDGANAWVPTFISFNFQLDSATALLISIIIPIINLIAIIIMQRSRGIKSELVLSVYLFCAAALAIAVIILLGDSVIFGTLLLFAVLTSAMISINTLLVIVVPTYFSGSGRVSLIAGVLNASVYVGSSISLFGIGSVVQHFGWNVLFVILAFLALCGAGSCVWGAGAWKKFREEQNV